MQEMQSLTGYFCEDFYLEKFEGFYGWKKRKISWVPDTQNPIRLDIVILRPVCLAPYLLKDTVRRSAVH